MESGKESFCLLSLRVAALTGLDWTGEEEDLWLWVVVTGVGALKALALSRMFTGGGWSGGVTAAFAVLLSGGHPELQGQFGDFHLLISFANSFMEYELERTRLHQGVAEERKYAGINFVQTKLHKGPQKTK